MLIFKIKAAVYKKQTFIYDVPETLYIRNESFNGFSPAEMNPTLEPLAMW